MRNAASWPWALLLVLACGDSAKPAAAPASPPAPPAAPSSAPATPAPSAPNPCTSPDPITLEMSAGVTQPTPWGIDFRFVVDDDKKLGAGCIFQLRSGERRWETRRDNTNWSQQLTWRGFCWRGAERPERKALNLKIQVGPVCKDGKLQELGGCGATFGAS